MSSDTDDEWRAADEAAREAARAWMDAAAVRAAAAKPAAAAKAAAASRGAELAARAAEVVGGGEWLSRMRIWATRRDAEAAAEKGGRDEQ